MALPDWNRIDDRVQKHTCTDGGDEFKDFEAWVNKSTEDEIASQAQFATFTWAFLIEFSKRSVFRKKVIVVLAKLETVPKWVAVYRTQSELHRRIDELNLHDELRDAFGKMLEKGGAIVDQTSAASTSTGAILAEGWSEWEPLSQIIKTESYADAGDAFNAIKLKVAHSTPEEIGNQLAHAEVTWRFLFGFAAKKSTFRNLVRSVIERLREAPGWMDVFNSNADLNALASNLHKDLQAALSISMAEEVEQPPAPTIGEKMGEILGDKITVPTPEDKATAETNVTQPTEPAKALAETTPHASSSSALAESKGESSSSSFAPALSKEDDELPLPAVEETLDDLVKRCQIYIAQADALSASGPIPSYYCRRYAVELLGERYKKDQSKELATLLMSVMGRCESESKTLDLSHGQQQLEAFALKIYEEAEKMEGQQAAAYFYLANLLFESMQQFDVQVSAEIIEKQALSLFQGASHVGGAVLIAAAAPAPAPVAPTAPPAPTPAPAPTIAPALTPTPAPTPAPAQSAYPPAVVVPPSSLPKMEDSKKKRLAMEKSNLAAKKIENGSVKEAKALIIEALQILQS